MWTLALPQSAIYSLFYYIPCVGNASGGFHPNAGAYHQNPNMGIRVDDTSVAAQTDTTISELILTGKNVCMRAISEITLKGKFDS